MTTDTDLSVEENLDIYAKLYGVGREERKRAITELLELVHLSDRRKSLVGTLSGGMRRRVELARGLVHHPTSYSSMNLPLVSTPCRGPTCGR